MLIPISLRSSFLFKRQLKFIVVQNVFRILNYIVINFDSVKLVFSSFNINGNGHFPLILGVSSNIKSPHAIYLYFLSSPIYNVKDRISFPLCVWNAQTHFFVFGPWHRPSIYWIIFEKVFTVDINDLCE